MALARHRQDVIANNLANAQTTGFKRDLALYTQRPLEAMDLPGGRRFLPEHLKEMTGGGFAAATFTDFTQGPVEVSERPLDVMLQGPGMLAVQDGEKVAYTRDGKLTLLGQKLVRAVDGRPVLDVDGNEICFNGATLDQLTVDPFGCVRHCGVPAAQLGIFEFEDLQSLVKLGSNMFGATEPPLPAGHTTVVSGVFEASGVNPALELVEMIKNTRAFELSSRMIMLQDETLGRLVNELPKL